MSYVVHIEVRHHPRHEDDWERKEWSAFKFADLPEGTDELVYVVNGLREMAAEIDPRVRCGNCGELRGDHLREGHLYRCFNRMGPITQAKWWDAEAPNAHRTSESPEGAKEKQTPLTNNPANAEETA